MSSETVMGAGVFGGGAVLVPKAGASALGGSFVRFQTGKGKQFSCGAFRGD